MDPADSFSGSLGPGAVQIFSSGDATGGDAFTGVDGGASIRGGDPVYSFAPDAAPIVGGVSGGLGSPLGGSVSGSLDDLSMVTPAPAPYNPTDMPTGVDLPPNDTMDMILAAGGQVSRAYDATVVGINDAVVQPAATAASDAMSAAGGQLVDTLSAGADAAAAAGSAAANAIGTGIATSGIGNYVKFAGVLLVLYLMSRAGK